MMEMEVEVAMMMVWLSVIREWRVGCGDACQPGLGDEWNAIWQLSFGWRPLAERKQTTQAPTSHLYMLSLQSQPID